LCIHELEERRAQRDIEQWRPLLDWMGWNAIEPVRAQEGPPRPEARGEGGQPSGTSPAGDRDASATQDDPVPQPSPPTPTQASQHPAPGIPEQSESTERAPEVPTFLRNPHDP
jgi:hypothetical protein